MGRQTHPTGAFLFTVIILEVFVLLIICFDWMQFLRWELLIPHSIMMIVGNLEYISIFLNRGLDTRLLSPKRS